MVARSCAVGATRRIQFKIVPLSPVYENELVIPVKEDGYFRFVMVKYIRNISRT